MITTTKNYSCMIQCYNYVTIQIFLSEYSMNRKESCASGANERNSIRILVFDSAVSYLENQSEVKKNFQS